MRLGSELHECTTLPFKASSCPHFPIMVSSPYVAVPSESSPSPDRSPTLLPPQDLRLSPFLPFPWPGPHSSLGTRTVHSFEDLCCCSVAKSCPILFRSPQTVAHQAPSVQGISPARILEWVAISSSRGSSQSRDQTHISFSCIAGRFFTTEPPGKPLSTLVVTNKKVYKNCPDMGKSEN